MSKYGVVVMVVFALMTGACTLATVESLPTATPAPTLTPIRNPTATPTLASAAPAEPPLDPTPTSWMWEPNINPPNPNTAANRSGVSQATVVPESDFNGCPAREGWIVYTVARGDTVTGIAQRLDVSYNAIVEANCLRNPEQIVIGQLLQLPPPESE